MGIKTTGIYITLPEPSPKRPVPSHVDPRTGEVIGAIMEHNSVDNVATWWGVFTDMAEECPDWARGKGRHRHDNR